MRSHAHDVTPGVDPMMPEPARTSLLVICSLAAGALITDIVRDNDAYERATVEQREAAQQENTELRAVIADYQSWDCAQVKPQYRSVIESKWCQRERNER